MKKLLFIFPILLSVLFISCSDEDNAPKIEIPTETPTETPEEPIYGLCRVSIMAIDWRKEVTPGRMPYISGTLYFFEVKEKPEKFTFYKEISTITVPNQSPIKASYTSEVKTTEPCVTIVKAPVKYLVVFVNGETSYPPMDWYFEAYNDRPTGTNFIIPK